MPYTKKSRGGGTDTRKKPPPVISVPKPILKKSPDGIRGVEGRRTQTVGPLNPRPSRTPSLPSSPPSPRPQRSFSGPRPAAGLRGGGRKRRPPARHGPADARRLSHRRRRPLKKNRQEGGSATHLAPAPGKPPAGWRAAATPHKTEGRSGGHAPARCRRRHPGSAPPADPRGCGCCCCCPSRRRRRR